MMGCSNPLQLYFWLAKSIRVATVAAILAFAAPIVTASAGALDSVEVAQQFTGPQRVPIIPGAASVLCRPPLILNADSTACVERSLIGPLELDRGLPGAVSVLCRLPLVPNADNTGCVEQVFVRPSNPIIPTPGPDRQVPGIVPNQPGGTGPATTAAPELCGRLLLPPGRCGQTSPGTTPGRDAVDIRPSASDQPGNRPLPRPARSDGCQPPNCGPVLTFLEVQRFVGDVNVGGAWGTNHSVDYAQTLNFRWWSIEDDIVNARLFVDGGLAGRAQIESFRDEPIDFPSASMTVVTQPYYMSTNFPGRYDRLLFQVEIETSNGQTIRSNPVTVRLIGDPRIVEIPSINLPKIEVTINSLHVIEDSDESGEGELRACFWLVYSGGQVNGETPFVILRRSITDGETFDPAITFIIENNFPRWVTVYGWAVDDDVFEGIGGAGIGEFIDTDSSGHCVRTNSVNDLAQGHQMIIAAAGGLPTQTAIIPYSPIYIGGQEDLQFEISGTWQVVP